MYCQPNAIIQCAPVPVEMEEIAAVQPARSKGKAWWRSRPFLIISIGLHLLFGLGAAYLVVSHYSASRKLTFAAGPKSPNPSERALQHRVQMQEKSKSAPAAVPKRVLSTGAAKIELPPMPEIAGAKTGPPVPKMACGWRSRGGSRHRQWVVRWNRYRCRH